MEEELNLLEVDKIAGTPYTIDVMSTIFNIKIIRSNFIDPRREI